jgi:hypothetical protein
MFLLVPQLSSRFLLLQHLLSYREYSQQTHMTDYPLTQLQEFPILLRDLQFYLFISSIPWSTP